MAKEKGFYAQNGLNVNLIEFQVDKQAVSEVSKGNAEFGIGRSDLLLERLNNNTNFLFMMTLCQASPIMIQTTKKSGIRNIEDLKDKIKLVYGEKDVASILSMLHSKGLTKNDFKELLSTDYTLKHLVDGSADFVEGYSTITPYHLKKMGYSPVSFHPKDYGFDFYGDILFTMEKYAKENPLIVENFYKSSLKGWEYAFAHIDETIDIIKSKYDSQKLERDLLKFEANEFKKLAFFQGVPFGNINEVKLEKIANTFKLLGQTKSSLNDFKDFIYKPLSKQKDISLTLRESKFIEQNPIIKVGVRKNLEPLDFIKQDGLHTGLSHDILDFISQKTGLRFMYIPYSNEELKKALENKDIDLMVSYNNIKNSNFIQSESFFRFKNYLNLKYENNETSINNLYFLIQNNQDILKNIFDKTISLITLKQKEHIKNRWIPQVVERFDWTLFWEIIFILCIIIIALIYINIKQKKNELKLKEQSYIDDLTKAFNRKSFNENISQSLNLFKRYKTPFCIAMYDIDDFKSINDTYGHNIGDKVLFKITKTVQSHIRVTDKLFRVGGEEFIIIFSSSTLADTLISMEKIKSIIANMREIENKEITISIGLTEFKNNDTVNTIYKRVDELLYNSKNNGKNKISK